MEYPKLRYIDAFPVEHEGGKYICLKDPQSSNGNILLVLPQVVNILSYFTGKNSFITTRLLVGRCVAR